MIFQLILREVSWYQFLINISISIIGRSLDLISTRYVSKELKLETNKLAKRVGWKGMVLMQIPIIILGTLDFYISFFILELPGPDNYKITFTDPHTFFKFTRNASQPRFSICARDLNS